MSNGLGNIYLDMDRSNKKHIEDAMVNLIDMLVEDEYGELEQVSFPDKIKFQDKNGNTVFEVSELNYNTWVEHEFYKQIMKMTNDHNEVYLKKYFQKKHSILPNKIFIFF